jgi:hypothetical protein
MAKTATKKTAKKVSTAKGKGKAVKKAATKKPVDPNAYGRFYIEDTPTASFPELVTITKAPAAWAGFIGKKYVNRDKAIAHIDLSRAENLISTGGRKVKEELIEAGLLGIDAE